MRGAESGVLSREATILLFLIIFKIFYLFIFRERGREGEREGNLDMTEKH